MNVDCWTRQWKPNLFEVELSLAAGYPITEPVYVTVNTTGSVAGPGQLGNTFQYWASGYEGTSGTNAFYVQGIADEANNVATVTPEPLTIILLGSGLAGMGGAAALRRRRAHPEGEDSL